MRLSKRPATSGLYSQGSLAMRRNAARMGQCSTLSDHHQCPDPAARMLAAPLHRKNDRHVINNRGAITYPVSANLLPLHSLSRDRQLPPQALETAFSQVHKSPIQLLLELVLRLRNFPDSRLSTTSASNVHLLAGTHPHVAVLVVMYIDLDRPVQRVRGRVEDVCRAPAAVPEVLRRVLVRYEQDGDAVVGLSGIDAYG